MPGPGGGARGGGGSRNGGFGGGAHPPNHGGVFGGGYYGGMGRGRVYRRGCGGCLGTVVVIVFLLMFFATDFVTNIFTSLGFKVVSYDENTFQDYANEQYDAEFGRSEAYEDNLLLVFLADAEGCSDYYYIAWVGDHIAGDINDMLGNEQTELGRAVAESVNVNSYKYSLDSNLARVVETMQEHIVSKGLASSFNCQETHAGVASHITNKTSLELTEETVNTALQNFTQTTGIPIVVVVDDIDDVFAD